MTARPLSFVFAGGGTGGHLYPGIAIAEAIRARVPDAAITFIGTREKIEGRVVPTKGFGFAAIRVVGFRRSLSLQNFLFPFLFVKSLAQSYAHLRRLQPAVVIGTGGYVSGPPLLVASWLGMPTVVQEQNSAPGVTTRMLAKRATEIHLTYPESARFFPHCDRVFISGNPTRAAIGSVARTDGARRFALNPASHTVCVFGGSLGASSINQAALGALPRLSAAGVQVIWQTGQSDFESVTRDERVRAAEATGAVKVFPFIDDMEFAYAASDLAICRAGATTLAELTRAGLPSILVPYPRAAADHQTANARTMEKAGAAVMCKDGDAASTMGDTIAEILGDAGRLQSMSAAARALGKPEAAETIARAILSLAGAP